MQRESGIYNNNTSKLKKKNLKNYDVKTRHWAR